MLGRLTARIPLLLALAATLALAGCIEAPGQTASGGSASGASPAPEGTAACANGGAGGGGAGGSQGGGSQAGVSNQPGSFSYGGQTMAKTATETYVWQNPAPRASINWGGQTMAGTFELVLLDACGLEVYRTSSGAMRQGSASEVSEVGTGGAWTIRLEFTAYSGQMGLSITSA